MTHATVSPSPPPADQLQPPEAPPEADKAPPDAHPSGEPYSLGVLFVHGIGSQPRGDTLARFADPICVTLSRWIEGHSTNVGKDLGEDATAAWVASMEVRESEIRMLAAAERMLAGSKGTSPSPNPSSLDGSDPYYCGDALLMNGSISSVGEEKVPAHAILDIRLCRKSFVTDTSHILLAECWWAENFVPPTLNSLLEWIFKVFPLAMCINAGDSVRRSFERAREAAPGTIRRTASLICALGATLQVLTLLPLAVLIQISLLLTMPLALLPIDWLRNIIGKIHRALTGIIGDSYLLCASPVVAAFVVGKFNRDLKWLSERCKAVAVVAHSQGCAVSYLGLCEAVPRNLHSVIWVGSGLRKLELLKELELKPERARYVLYGALAMIFIPTLLIYRLELGFRFAELVQFLFFATYATFAIGSAFFVLVWRTTPKGISTYLAHLTTKGISFLEWFASNDPVPNGPMRDMLDKNKSNVTSIEVYNRGSRMADHTSYWSNIEEVVLPISLRLCRLAGIPMDSFQRQDGDLRAAAIQIRRLRVNILRVARMLGILLALIMTVNALIKFFPSATSRHAQVAMLIPLLIYAFGFALLNMCWRAWDKGEQLDWLGRGKMKYDRQGIASRVVFCAFLGLNALALLWVATMVLPELVFSVCPIDFCGTDDTEVSRSFGGTKIIKGDEKL